MVETGYPPSVDTLSNGKRRIHPSSPQPNDSARSPGTPFEHNTPGYKPPYANPPALPNDGSSASPSSPAGRGVTSTSSVESSLGPSITTLAISAAPNSVRGNIRASQGDTLRMASGMHAISPPSSSHLPALVGLAYEESLEEPVEEGLMSRYDSSPISASMPPPYSHD